MTSSQEGGGGGAHRRKFRHVGRDADLHVTRRRRVGQVQCKGKI